MQRQRKGGGQGTASGSGVHATGCQIARALNATGDEPVFRNVPTKSGTAEEAGDRKGLCSAGRSRTRGVLRGRQKKIAGEKRGPLSKK